MIKMVKWIKIPECGFYMVSSCGKVKSASRVIIRSNGRHHTTRERILKPAMDSNGYNRVAFNVVSKLTTFKVHRLVASAFCLKQAGKNEVNHINGIKTDNRCENLEWVNRSENMLHAFSNNLCRPVVGENNASAKITEMIAITIKTMIMSGLKLSKIARDYKVSIHIVKDISRGRTWKHLNV